MKHTIRLDRPVETLGELLSELNAFVERNPNPGEESRQVRLQVTPGGKLRAFTVTDS